MEEIGERLFVNNSGPFPEMLVENKHWVRMVDVSTRKLWSNFNLNQAWLPKKENKHLLMLKEKDLTFKYVCCDNVCIFVNHGIILDYTDL